MSAELNFNLKRETDIKIENCLSSPSDPSDIYFSTEYNLLPFVIPLERVQVAKCESDNESENDFANMFEHLADFPSVSEESAASTDVSDAQALADLELINKSRRCPICKVPSEYSSVFKLSSHILNHYDIKLYPCAHCDQRFASATKLCSHIRRFHCATKNPLRSRTCTICDKLFSACSQLSKHMLKQHADALNKVKIEEHQRISTCNANKHRQCPMCPVQFHNIPQLARHLVLRHRQNVTRPVLRPNLPPVAGESDKRPRCDFKSCNDMKFMNEKRLKLHHQHVHHNVDVKSQASDLFVCPTCESETPFSCEKLSQMSEHLIDQHSHLISEQRHAASDLPANCRQCPFCEFTTPNHVSRFDYHILNHFNVCLFKCARCEQRFHTSQQLIGHRICADRFRVSLKAAEEKVVQFLCDGVQRNFCPVKNEILSNVSTCTTEPAPVRLQCNRIQYFPAFNSSTIPMRINNRFALVDFAFSTRNEIDRTGTNTKIITNVERISCPLCKLALSPSELRLHLKQPSTSVQQRSAARMERLRINSIARNTSGHAVLLGTGSRSKVPFIVSASPAVSATPTRRLWTRPAPVSVSKPSAAAPTITARVREPNYPVPIQSAQKTFHAPGASWRHAGNRRNNIPVLGGAVSFQQTQSWLIDASIRRKKVVVDYHNSDGTPIYKIKDST